MVEDGYKWVTHFVLGLVGTWLLLTLIVKVFYKLISAGDMRSKFPQVLAFNVYAYCLGPSILALIPFHIGPPIAVVWIFCLFVFAAINRLAIKPSGAIICNAITYWGFGGPAVSLYFIVRY